MPDTLETQRAEFEAKYAGRDIQQDRNHLWMTEAQLQRAALRLTMKTRIGGADHKTGASDPGTDGALVADAYLKVMREDREAMTIIREAAELIKTQPPRPRVDTTKLKMHPSIQLASGRYFDFLEPHTTPLEITDIAAGLSRICRYTGQLAIDEDAVYTVAQHSVLASENCDPDCDPFEALMHDAPESTINDMASPLKQLLLDYKEVEARVETAIADYYGLPHPMTDACKRIDLRMLATEKRDLMPNNVGDEKWALIAHITPLPFTIRPWSPAEAKHRFLHRFYWLTEGRLPKPSDRFSTPHENAPSDYVAALVQAWGYDPRGLKTDFAEAKPLTLERAAEMMRPITENLQTAWVEKLLYGDSELDPYAFDGFQQHSAILRNTPPSSPTIMEIDQEALKSQVRPIEDTLSAIDVINAEIKKAG